MTVPTYIQPVAILADMSIHNDSEYCGEQLTTSPQRIPVQECQQRLGQISDEQTESCMTYLGQYSFRGL